ncbi:extensin-like isoform X2 [Setaria italica]|uniref:extensin-like isoform X2 n=1 Tax=Setaria italica TaxID=4555 RepID=UPI000BE5904D|nr:extensin-like isoform X2 [Setaria italica]
MAAVVAPPSTGAPQPRRPASVGRRHPPLYISLTRGPICPTPSDPPFPYTFTPTPSPQTPLAEATTRSTNRGPRVHETVPEPAPSHCVSQRENARCSRELFIRYQIQQEMRDLEGVKLKFQLVRRRVYALA